MSLLAGQVLVPSGARQHDQLGRSARASVRDPAATVERLAALAHPVPGSPGQGKLVLSGDFVKPPLLLAAITDLVPQQEVPEVPVVATAPSIGRQAEGVRQLARVTSHGVTTARTPSGRAASSPPGRKTRAPVRALQLNGRQALGAATRPTASQTGRSVNTIGKVVSSVQRTRSALAPHTTWKVRSEAGTGSLTQGLTAQAAMVAALDRPRQVQSTYVAAGPDVSEQTIARVPKGFSRWPSLPGASEPSAAASRTPLQVPVIVPVPPGRSDALRPVNGGPLRFSRHLSGLNAVLGAAQPVGRVVPPPISGHKPTATKLQVDLARPNRPLSQVVPPVPPTQPGGRSTSSRHYKVSSARVAGGIPSNGTSVTSSQDPLIVNLTGDILVDGRKLGRLTASSQARAAALPAHGPSRVNLHVVPSYSGAQIPQ